jgi:hypothetical protein
MPDVTEAEYDALDEVWTNNPPAVSGDGKSGVFMQRRGEIVLLDTVSAVWLRAKSEATHRSATEIIGDMVQKEIASMAHEPGELGAGNP